jgi:hypothetical protein
MKIFSSFLISLVFIIFLFFISTNEDQRWLMFNEASATEYAVEMLKGNQQISIPNNLIDYTISSKDGYVLFVNSSDNVILYGYFPTKKPDFFNGDIAKVKWDKLNENWFVSHP